MEKGQKRSLLDGRQLDGWTDILLALTDIRAKRLALARPPVAASPLCVCVYFCFL